MKKQYIEFKNISFGYNKQNKILHNCSFNIEKSRTTFLVGNNGQGKTTIINLILKMYKPQSGDIFCESVNIKNINQYKKNIGFSLNKVEYYSFMIVLDFFKYLSIMYKDNQKNFEKNLKKYSSIFDIEEHLLQPISQLSKGTRKKIEIISSLFFDPDCIIMDEPFSDLDENSRKKLITILKSKEKEGKTIFIITHDIYLIDEFNNYEKLVINEGKVEKYKNE